MDLKELKQIHKTYREAKKAKVKANYQYRDEHGVPNGTTVLIGFSQYPFGEEKPTTGIITNREIDDNDFEIYYTIHPVGDNHLPDYSILLGRVKRDGFEIVGE
jgi:hypothetical protein